MSSKCFKAVESPKDERIKGPRDQGTKGPGDQGTKGPRDQGTWGPGDQGTKGPGDQGREDWRRGRVSKGPKDPSAGKMNMFLLIP